MMIGSSPIRILHVTGGMNRAGTETMLMNIYRNVDHEKVQFDFISYNKEESHYDREIKKLGGRIIQLNKTNSIIEIYNAIKKYGPYQAIHSHTLFHCGIANIAGFLAGVKVRIAHAHTTQDDSDQWVKKVYIACMRKMILKASTDLLSCSEQAGGYLYGEPNLKRTRYTYFPNVIDYIELLVKPHQQVNEFKMKYGLGNSLVIGHVGRFMEAKNHPFLLSVMKAIVEKDPAAKLLLVGDGDSKKQMEDMSTQLGIKENVIFAGVREDMATMFHSMDIFVFPSTYEGLGLVLLEAQASGLPCIVSEAIQPEADLNMNLFTKLSLSESPEAWADKILERAGYKEKNINKIINSFELHHYSINKGITKLLTIYRGKQGGHYEKTFNHLL